MSEQIKILKEGRKRAMIIGTLGDDKIFRKKVKYSKDYLEKYKCYGINKEAIEELKNKGCAQIELLDTENNLIWKVNFNLFIANGWNWTYGKKEEKTFLEKKWWDIFNTNKSRVQKGQKDPLVKTEAITPQLELL